MGVHASLKQTNKQENKHTVLGQNQQVDHQIANSDQVQPHHLTDRWAKAREATEFPKPT